MAEKWLRRADENEAAWAAFQAYLLQRPRNEVKCAEIAGRSESTIRRWAARFEWKERARQFDNEQLEETRLELRRRLTDSFLTRWQDLDEMARLAVDALRGKIPTATARTLNEVVTAATEKQLALMEKLDVLNPALETEKTVVINIVDAE